MTEYQSGVSATVKAHGGYDAPWIVFHGTDAEHVSALISEAQRVNLVDQVAEVSQQFATAAPPKQAVQQQPAQQAPQGGYGPQQGQGAPQGGYNRQGPPQGGQGGYQGGQQGPALATHCRHGEKLPVSGISQKTGKPWAGFDCPQNYKTGECARFAKAE